MLILCFRVSVKESTSTTLRISIQPRWEQQIQSNFSAFCLARQTACILKRFFFLKYISHALITAWLHQRLLENSPAAGEGQETVPGHPHHPVIHIYSAVNSVTVLRFTCDDGLCFAFSDLRCPIIFGVMAVRITSAWVWLWSCAMCITLYYSYYFCRL